MIALIIINWNGYDDTIECIDSLQRARGSEALKILVIDNGSRDKTEIERIAKQFPRVSTIRNAENLGFTGANNQGFRWSKEIGAEYVMILNNDVEVHPDFLQPLLESLMKNPRALVSPKIIFYGTHRLQNVGGTFSPFLSGRNWKKNKPAEIFTDEYHPDYLSGCCWVMPVSAVDDIGYFDDTFFAYIEDVDYSVRAQKNGYDLIVNGKSSIFHKHSRSTKGNYLKVYYLLKNHLYFLQKHSYSRFTQIVAIACLFCVTFLINKNVRWIDQFVKGVREGYAERV